MLGEQAPDEIRAGGGSPGAAAFIPPSCSLSTGDVPPARGTMMGFVFHGEIICFPRRKRSLGQTKKNELRNLSGMSQTKQLIWGYQTKPTALFVQIELLFKLRWITLLHFGLTIHLFLLSSLA